MELWRLTDYRSMRRDDEGRYAGVRRETLLNGVRISVCLNAVLPTTTLLLARRHLV